MNDDFESVYFSVSELQVRCPNSTIEKINIERLLSFMMGFRLRNITRTLTHTTSAGYNETRIYI